MSSAELIALKSAIQTMVSDGMALCLKIERLPLAVYREAAAHLKQLESIDVAFIPQTSTEFDYLQSQVGGLQLTPQLSSTPADGLVSDRLVEILQHYAQRFGPWTKI